MKHSHDGFQVKKVDRVSSTLVRLTIEFGEKAIEEEQQRQANRYSQSANIKGFRPGKAPLSIIKQKYKGEIEKDAISHLLEHGISHALEETKLVPISQPQVKFGDSPFEAGKPFEFQAEFEVQPEIELRHYTGIPLKRTEEEATDEEVNETFNTLRERMASLEPTDQEQAEKGLFGVLEVGFKLKDGDKAEEPKPITLELGAGKLVDELDNAILEMKVGEQKLVTATFPEDFGTKELAGKEAEFDCKLLELKKKVMPELDDAFAESVSQGSTLEQLRKEIVESIVARKIEENEQNQRKEITDYLVANHSFEVPASLVQRQTQSLLQWMQDDMKRRGMNQMPELKGPEMEEIQKRADQMVRSSLLLREIAKKENLEVDPNRMETKIEEIAARVQKDKEETRGLLEERGAMQNLRDEVLTDQVFELLVSKAEIVDAKPKAEKSSS